MQRRALVSLLSSSLCLAALACGGEAKNENDAAGSGSGGATSSSASGGPSSTSSSSGSGGLAGDWETLIDASWQLTPATEGYWCATKIIEEDMYIRAFRAIAPVGTHHTVVSKTGGGEPHGEWACSAGTLSDEMIFASGVGTNDLAFPEGVAMEVKAGTQLLINLHLFNTSTDPLEGLSGTEVLTLPASEVVQKAEMIFAGSVAIFIAPNSAGDANGSCQFPQDATVMTVWPHMHQYGTHMKVVHESGAGDVVLHDAAYSFSEQTNYPIDPTVVKAGERIHVYCDYNNTSSSTVTFGDSSTQEMCFAGLYRYPALGDGLFCDLPI